MSYIVKIAALAALSFAAPVAAKDIVLSDAKLHVEGVDVAADGRIFVGSLIDSSVWVIAPDHASAQQFTQPGSLGMDSAVGLKVRENSNELYVCSGPVLGVSDFADSALPAGVLVYDLTTGAAKARFDFPGGGFCNDIAFGPDGTLYATDSFNPRILHLTPGARSLDVFAEHPDLGGEGWVLNGLAVHHDTLYTVKQSDGRMFGFDIGSKGMHEVALPRPLNSPDGLLVLDDGRALVVETGRADVTTFAIANPAETWVEHGIDGLKVPATAALMPHGMLVIANTQNDHLTEDPGTTDPFTVTIATLK